MHQFKKWTFTVPVLGLVGFDMYNYKNDPERIEQTQSKNNFVSVSKGFH